MNIFRNSSQNLSDEEIIARYKTTGKPAVLDIIFKRYGKLVFGLCLKYFKNPHTAEDETMSIFEKLISDLRKHNIECFRAWLYKYAKNHCLMALRKKAPRFVELNDYMVENKEENLRQKEKEALHKDFYLSYVVNLLDILKDEQRICLKLFFLCRKSYREVSIETGIPINQVKSNIQNGKRNLKNHIQKSQLHPYENDDI